MRYESVLGLDHIKNHLRSTVINDRIAHAQLFVGSTGSGLLPIALAYARDILCSKSINPNCHAQMDAITHPDLHFSFPIAKDAARSGEKPVCNDFMTLWFDFVKQQPYGDIAAWTDVAQLDKKEVLINVHEAGSISKKLSLKPYDGGYKVLIIWNADRMNDATANKLLKLVEEPPDKTIILLLAQDEERIINTIKSRCQILHIPKMPTAGIVKGLLANTQTTESQAQQIARQANGDYFKALQLVNQSHEDASFEKWFIEWIRAAFRAKGNKTVIKDLIQWSETIATLNRDSQKRFLNYCLEFFRQAMLLNYKATTAVYLVPQAADFDIHKFAPFVDGHRIVEINTVINDAIFHIERNGNNKIILTDLAISLTKILHTPS